MLPKHQEMLGEEAKDCGVSVSLEWTGVEGEIRSHMGLTYILYRCLLSLRLLGAWCCSRVQTRSVSSP